MKHLKTIILALSLLIVGGGNLMAQTEAQADAAIATIENGKVHTISTYFNGSETGNVKYYLKTDGYLTNTEASAGLFTFTKADGGTWLAGKGYKINKFTNGGNSSNTITSDAEKHIIVGGSNRDDFEGQVFYLNDEGNYAIRSTNSNSSSWAASAFYNVVADNDEDGLPNATYVMNSTPWIWKVERENRPEYISAIDAWAYKLNTLFGLVDGNYTSNAKDTGEGSYEALLDNNYSTYFHSSYRASAPDEDHYLQATLKEATQKIRFYFKKRSQNNNNRPTQIDILASNDGTNFTLITSINSGLPTSEDKIAYASDVIDMGGAYKYVRFSVASTNNNAKAGADGAQHVFFTFSEFYVLPELASFNDAFGLINANYSFTQITNEIKTQVDDIDDDITTQFELQVNREAFETMVTNARAFTNTEGVFTNAETAKSNFETTVTEQRAIVNAATQASQIETCIENIKKAAITFATSVTINEGKSLNVTDFAIVNPTPTTNADGWTCSVAPNAFDPSNNNAEFWNQKNASIKQTISNLPAGIYCVSATAVTRDTYVTYLTAAGKSMTIVTMPNSGTEAGVDYLNLRSDCKTWFDAGNGVNKLVFVLNEPTNVEIGLTTGTVGDAWTVWRGFGLEVLEESVIKDVTFNVVLNPNRSLEKSPYFLLD